MEAFIIVFLIFAGLFLLLRQENKRKIEYNNHKNEQIESVTALDRGTWSELEDTKERIEQYFNQVSGKTVITDNGSAVAVFYGNSLIVPTGDAELKSIQINLNVKEWKVNN